MKWFFSILEVCLKELKIALTDTGTLLFFIVVPLLYPALYSFLYNGEVVREVPTVVVDESHTAVSRDFLHRVDASPDVAIVAYCADLNEARELVNSHKAYAIVHIPSDFTQTLNNRQQGRINVYSDMSGLLYYKSIYSATSEVSLEMNREIKVQRLSDTTLREAEVGADPIKYSYAMLFNPQSGFASFLIPAVLMLIIQQTLVLGIGLLHGTSHEKLVRGEITKESNIHHRPSVILVGKALAYIAIYAVITTYLVCTIPQWFHLLQLAKWSDLLLFMIPYLFACIFFAMTVLLFVKEREDTFMIFVFISIPLIFMSGISWPRVAMPNFWHYFSYIFPSTFGVNGFVRIKCMGATLRDVMPEYIALWLQTGIYFFTSYLVYKFQSITHKRNLLSIF